jgi:hypothetical protein
MRAGIRSTWNAGNNHARRWCRGVPSRMIAASMYTSMKDRRSASRLYQVLGETTQISIM